MAEEKVITKIEDGWRWYRKKPIRVKAIRMDCPFRVETMEGWLKGKTGDYLIQGVKGELYLCDAKIWKLTYDLI